MERIALNILIAAGVIATGACAIMGWLMILGI
jgi:hypothetical protein